MPIPEEATETFRVVRDGIPGMDGTYKTIAISQNYTDRDAAERAYERVTALPHGETGNIRVQHCWTTPWEDLE